MENTKQEMVTITKNEYTSLLNDQLMLVCLQGAGVDNWSGYDFAIQDYNDQLNDEK